jgi:SPP1 gp7 family putative phage head morphogenesis protein
VRWIHGNKKTAVDAGDINENAIQPLLDGINAVLQDGFNRGIEHSVPYMMQRNLSENVYLFSGAKTYAELKELGEMLSDENGGIKPFGRFWRDAQSIYPGYNRSYLQAEYIFATQSAQMASKWHDYEADGDRYDLQYRTAGDERVRETHRVLQDVTLPPSDPFWEKYFPPNGWRCRCTAVQVRKGKYPASDGDRAQNSGERATGGGNGIFRFNPGKQQVIFPEHHPYFRELAGAEKSALADKAKELYGIKTAGDVVRAVSDLSKDKGWFERGFKKLGITRKASENGSTDMDGNIRLSKERLAKTISGINKLSGGEQIASDEADSLATFWHEITHNRNKKGNMYLSDLQTRYMELANEFVSRNTLPDFYGAFGSEVQYPGLMTNRKSTGYNGMVNNFQQIIDKTGLDKDKVVESVKKHLFDEPYDDQKAGLTKALEGARKADGSELKKTEINQLLKACDKKTYDSFESYLDQFIH